MSADLRFFASSPRYTSHLLADEIRGLGGSITAVRPGGIFFTGRLETALRACLWSRIASRVFFPLATFPADSPETLYEGVKKIAWEDHLSPEGTLAVDAHVISSRITHSHYAALKVKDAIVDRFRDRTGKRPSVDLASPRLRINLHLEKNTATVSIDLSGGALHRRGYREEGTIAPLKENLAAAILVTAGWPAMAAKGENFLDPMCGSGTLVIEAALMAADIAPGLLRKEKKFGFEHWPGMDDPGVWARLLSEARERRRRGIEKMPRIAGYDRDQRAVEAAQINAERAGLTGRIRLEGSDIRNLPRPAGEKGLLVVNPPYGERMGSPERLAELYKSLGEKLRSTFAGWRAAVLVAEEFSTGQLGVLIRDEKKFMNGPIPCRLLLIDPSSKPVKTMDDRTMDEEKRKRDPAFANRLKKNLRTIGAWAKREKISCYRLYDADIPEYAAAVDIYAGRAHVQEYLPPPEIDPERAGERLEEILLSVGEVLRIPGENIYLKTRQRQREKSQYERLDEVGEFFEVEEGGIKFLVNLTDRLDTGLFLDHRIIRKMIGEMSEGKAFLNLFGYTGTASVYAAHGGASTTTTVDLSRTYLDWAGENLSLNGFTAGGRNNLVQADCLEWLKTRKGRYDLIFLNPPTFSTSKRMRETFDIQRDYLEILEGAAKLLSPDGVIVFSTHFRKFRPAWDFLSGLMVSEITGKTIPKDFSRDPRTHRCFIVRRNFS